MFIVCQGADKIGPNDIFEPTVSKTNNRSSDSGIDNHPGPKGRFMDIEMKEDMKLVSCLISYDCENEAMAF